GGALAIGPYAGKGEEAFAEWRDGIRQVAGFPNTYVKLGGLGMKLTGFTFFENDMPPSSEDLEKAWRPYIEICISAFGPQRSVFKGSDRPDSDVDFLVEFERDAVPGLLGMAEIEAELSALLGRPVDLRTANELSPHFRQAVERAAEVRFAA